jgi:hypothetical protein
VRSTSNRFFSFVKLDTIRLEKKEAELLTSPTSTQSYLTPTNHEEFVITKVHDQENGTDDNSQAYHVTPIKISDKIQIDWRDVEEMDLGSQEDEMK